MNLDLRMSQEIEKEISGRLEKLAAELISGKATDYPDYKYRIGRIKSLQDALEAVHEANARVIGLERK
jgi:hypothetical protein